MDKDLLKALQEWATVGMNAFKRVMSIVDLVKSGKYELLTPEERETLLKAPSHEATIKQAEDEMKAGK